MHKDKGTSNKGVLKNFISARAMCRTWEKVGNSIRFEAMKLSLDGISINVRVFYNSW